MTSVELRQGHIALWKWLARTGSWDKEKWPGWGKESYYWVQENRECFACDACENMCSRCPIVWSHKGKQHDWPLCNHPGGEYWLWRNAKSINERRQIAAKIARMWPES